MAKLLLLFVTGASFFLGAQSQASITDPELDFINTPEDVRAEWGLIEAGHIIRRDFDLTGAGQPAVFLAYQGNGSKGGVFWTAYLPASAGYTRTDGVQFREDLVRAGRVDGINPDGGLVVLYPGAGGGKLVRYRVKGDRIIQEDLQQLDYSKPGDLQMFEGLFGRKPGQPMPDTYFKEPRHKVVEVKNIRARAASQTDGANTRTGAEDVVPKHEPMHGMPPKTTQNASDSSRAPALADNEPRSSAPWKMVTAALVCAAGLLVWWLKRPTRK